MMTLYIVGGLMVFMGIGIKYFKWYFLIAGFNTMSKEKKSNVDTEGLGNLMGNSLIIMAVLILGGGIADEYGYKLLSMILLLSIIPITIAIVFLAQRYDHNRKNNPRSRKIEMGVFIGSILAVIIAISSLFIHGSREVKVEIMEDRIAIVSSYGTMVKKENITEITLEDSIPKVLNKVNGFDLGYTLRGVFTVEGMGSGSIYIHENKPPYIVIKADKKFFIINYKDPNKTIELYEKLKLSDDSKNG